MRLISLPLILIVFLFVGGTAFAHWKASGAGTGTATTGSTVPLTVTPGVPTAALYPGGVANVVMTVSNPNGSAVRVGSLALDTAQGTGGFSVDAGHSGCAVTALSFTTQTNSGAGWTVPAKVGVTNGSLAITLPSPLAMNAGAAQACQGATITVFVTAGP